MRSRRYDRMRVTCSAWFLGQSYRAPGMVVSLSLDGCRAVAGFLINRDEPLGLLIHMPDDQQSPIYVTRAQVRWLEEYEVGIEFIHMSWEDHQRLSEMIRTMEGAH